MNDDTLTADKLKKDATKKLSTKEYKAELARLQGKLVKLQYWVKEKGLCVSSSCSRAATRPARAA